MNKNQHLLIPVLEDALLWGRWSGVPGKPLTTAIQPWRAGTCGPSLLAGCKPLSQAGETQLSSKSPIPYTTVCPSPGVNPQGSSCPLSLQPVIILKATIKTIETHVMCLGSTARLIPTSISAQRKRGAPRGWTLVLCGAGRDRVELQRTKLRVRRQ